MRNEIEVMKMSLSSIHLGNILREAYRQGYLNGFADADIGNDDCDLEKLCDDWVSEVLADGFVGDAPLGFPSHLILKDESLTNNKE